MCERGLSSRLEGRPGVSCPFLARALSARSAVSRIAASQFYKASVLALRPLNAPQGNTFLPRAPSAFGRVFLASGCALGRGGGGGVATLAVLAGPAHHDKGGTGYESCGARRRRRAHAVPAVSNPAGVGQLRPPGLRPSPSRSERPCCRRSETPSERILRR